jgi:hypothetical protein
VASALFLLLLGWIMLSSEEPKAALTEVESARDVSAKAEAPAAQPTGSPPLATSLSGSIAKTPQDLPLLENERSKPPKSGNVRPRTAKKRKAAKRDFGF